MKFSCDEFKEYNESCIMEKLNSFDNIKSQNKFIEVMEYIDSEVKEMKNPPSEEMHKIFRCAVENIEEKNVGLRRFSLYFILLL